MTNGHHTIDALLGALDSADVPFAFIGAAARNAWAPPRGTTDLDIAAVVDARGYERLVSALGQLGYEVVRAHRVEPEDEVPAVSVLRNENASPPYRQVDILAAESDFEQEAVMQAIRLKFAGRTAPVVRREHLLVYKLIAWRLRDRQDIADILATARLAEAEVDLDLLRHWARVWKVESRLEASLAEATSGPG